MQLQDTGQSLQSALPTVHRQYTMHGLPHSRLLLTRQQAVAHQLQLECYQWITLDLLTSVLPFFSHTYCTHEYCAYVLQSCLHQGELSDSAHR